MSEPPKGTVTFLFTDIEGSTQYWDKTPDLMRISLARHDELMRVAIEAHDGYVFKTIGDAFCAAFSMPADALAASLAAQQSLATENWETETPLQVRIALHAGTAQERDGDYFGPPLNRVARLLATGHGGQVLVSQSVKELTHNSLPTSCSLLDLGIHRLKDLGSPEQVFQLLHPSLASEFPMLRSLNGVDQLNNLPPQMTSFIGRERVLGDVKALLSKTRLLTLVGTGGAGKTRLSIQTAGDLLDQYDDGVWLVELAPLSDPALVPQVAAQVLGIKEAAGQPIQRTLVEGIKNKRLLLVLDNCEHLVSACAAFAGDLLRNCPRVRILASSRERLNIAGEQTYRVPSLSLPDLRLVHTAAELSQYESVRLFTERAQSVMAGFTVNDVNAQALAEVCRRLDGIPLAIELAAARVRSLTVEQIRDRLDHSFRLLTGGARDTLPRQQTLRALVDWSHDLLTQQEKALLRRLSVFAGGWSLTAAEFVCSGVEVDEWDVVDLLTSLVDKSLVVFDDGAGDGGRYRFLETIRQYASDRLYESNEANERQQRSAEWFLQLAEESEPGLLGSAQASWLTRLETEHDNLRASLSWCENPAAQAYSGLAEGSLRLVGSLARFWGVRGHNAEGRQWTGRALDAARIRNGTTGTPASLVWAKAHFAAAYLAYSQSDFDAARVSYEESLSMQRQLGNTQGIAVMLENLGNVAYELGNYERAQSLYDESLLLQRELGNIRGVASSLGNLGNVAHDRGDYQAARALHEECMSIQRTLGDLRGVANSLNNLGNAAHEERDYDAARVLHEESLELQRQLGNQRGIANSLMALGYLAIDRVDFGEARTLCHESLLVRQRLGDSKGAASAFLAMGDVALAEGDFAQARSLYEQSLRLTRQAGDQLGVASTLEELAAVAVSQNQPARAAQIWGAVGWLRTQIGAPLPPSAEHKRMHATSEARRALGDNIYAAAWNAGATMTVEQAVDYALSQE